MDTKINADMPFFLGYLQKRMDFIAQVATAAPSWCMVTSCDDLIKDFNERYCLVKNIIRSHQGIQDGPDFEPVLEKKYDSPEPPSLDIPHGQVGVQAFYTILENIVRNTAKYGDVDQLDQIKDPTKYPGDGKLIFTIAVNDRWRAKEPAWVENFYQVKIKERLRMRGSRVAEGGVVASLNRFLHESLTDPTTGVVKPKYWGMKEIKICAAYLRMVKQDQIDDKFNEWYDGTHEKEPPIIKVSLEDTELIENELIGNLTYTLYLLRPKAALVVMEQPTLTTDTFRRAGIDFYGLESFKAEIEQGERPRHSFLVLPKPANSEQWTWLAQNLNFLPPRVIVMDCAESEIPSGPLSRSLAVMRTPNVRKPGILMDQLREKWVERWWGDFKILVRWGQKYASTVADVGGNESEDVRFTTLTRGTGSSDGKDAEPVWSTFSIEEQKKWLAFDHRPQPDESELFKNVAYHEFLDSNSPTSSLLQRRARTIVNSEEISTTMLERQSRFRIKETAGLSVAIIDERVWLEKDGAATRGVTKYSEKARTREDVWKKRRVYLQDTNWALKDFVGFVHELKLPGRDVFDFIIIHQGIIDGVKDKLSPSDFQKASKNLRSKARWLVVDSGRGQPEYAREGNLRWVEYSNLAECLIQYAGDKFKLAELLWTLRASSKSEVAR